MIKIAILGFGTVGGGVAEVIAENAGLIARNAGDDIEVKYILDVRDFTGNPFEHIIIRDFDIIEKDPEVSVVVETIGGTGIAYEFTKRSLSAGKSVVTSNKELVATKGDELMPLAKEKNVNYMFEAAVGGGIPILRPLAQCLTANRIDEVYGILNGTTNYILTEMIQSGASFEEALRGAQKNGYAEQNPEADVEGKDACRKICILSNLSFGRYIDPDKIKTAGITGVSLEDVESASRAGYRIKLLGRALRTGEDSVTAYVAPHLVSDSNLLARVDGVMNGIVVHGNAVGEVMFYGAGAGKRPTASAVVADVIDAARHMNTHKALEWGEASPGYVTDSDELVSGFFVRVRAAAGAVQKALGNVSFLGDSSSDTSAFITAEISGSELFKRLNGLEIVSAYRIIS